MKRRGAEAVQREYPGKMMAYNCSPSFNWEAKLDKATIARFQRELGAMGYKFQFVTLAGFHALNLGMFELASGYRDRGMAAQRGLHPLGRHVAAEGGEQQRSGKQEEQFVLDRAPGDLADGVVGARCRFLIGREYLIAGVGLFRREVVSHLWPLTTGESPSPVPGLMIPDESPANAQEHTKRASADCYRPDSYSASWSIRRPIAWSTMAPIPPPLPLPVIR